jgi:hypothetical protein
VTKPITEPNVIINETKSVSVKNECSDTGMKRCRVCQMEKPLNDFYKDIRGNQGRYGSCKKCTVIKQSKYQSKHRERRKVYMRKYQSTESGKQKLKNYYRKNREHVITQVSIYAKKNPLKSKAFHLKKSHGITMEQFEQMFISQNGQCAICKKSFEARRDVHVDHNHTTKQIRQLLCHHCNVGIGNFRENPEFLVQAVQYLQKWNRL